jgi:hypothetical protein
MHPIRSLLLIPIVLSLAPRAAQADAAEDFAFEVRESTGYYHREWVITKYTTLKVGKKCWDKIVDKANGAVNSATYFARDVAEYAKGVTGDDWSSIETQNNNDREANKKLIEPMMDAFKSKFKFTLVLEGDDCNAKRNALWLNYWTTVGQSLSDNPPKAGKVAIRLEVTSKVKDVTVKVDKTGGSFVITAPADLEVVGWSDKIDKAFRKVSSKTK